MSLNTYIEAITPVSASIGGTGVTTATITVNAINPDMVELVWNNFNTTSGANNPSVILPRVEKASTTATSVTFNVIRNTGNTTTTTFTGFAVEHTSLAVESITYGTISIAGAGTSGTATIGVVDTSRSIRTFIGCTTTGVSSTSGQLCGFDLTNATTVTMHKGLSNTMTGAFCVVQYKAGILVQFEQRADTFANSNSLDAVTLANTYILANTQVFYGGISTSQASYTNYFMSGQLDNSTPPNSSTLNIIRSGSSTASRTFYSTIAQFIPAYYNSIQQGAVEVGTPP